MYGDSTFSCVCKDLCRDNPRKGLDKEIGSGKSLCPGHAAKQPCYLFWKRWHCFNLVGFLSDNASAIPCCHTSVWIVISLPGGSGPCRIRVFSGKNETSSLKKEVFGKESKIKWRLLSIDSRLAFLGLWNFICNYALNLQDTKLFAHLFLF